MTDLLAFLRARLDEDEAEAQADEVLAHEQATGWLPERVLREVDAKRRIVELHKPSHDRCWTCMELPPDDDYAPAVAAKAPCLTIRLLTTPYADHPDYDENWRP